MKAKITFENGKTAEIELTEEQAAQITKAEKKNPFERVRLRDSYYVIDVGNEVCTLSEDDDMRDHEYFNAANYCTDCDLLQQQAYRETLNRLLWRFTYENGWSEDLWETTDNKYYLDYNVDNKAWSIRVWRIYKIVGVVYFVSQEIAEHAIDEVVKPFLEAHPDFRDYQTAAESSR